MVSSGLVELDTGVSVRTPLCMLTVAEPQETDMFFKSVSKGAAANLVQAEEPEVSSNQNGLASRLLGFCPSSDLKVSRYHSRFPVSWLLHIRNRRSD